MGFWKKHDPAFWKKYDLVENIIVHVLGLGFFVGVILYATGILK